MARLRIFKVTMGWSSQLTYRLMTMMRGQLISLVYSKALELPITESNESAAMTLMNADVNSIASAYHFLLLDLFPNVVQLAIAIYLLSTQLGAVCIAPVLVTLSKPSTTRFTRCKEAHVSLQYLQHSRQC